MTFSNLLWTLRGACFFSPRRNAQNLSRSRRSTSSTFTLWQDSTKHARAVLYAASVFGFFVSFVSSRYSATDAASDLWPSPFSGTTGTPLFTAFNSASLRSLLPLASAASFPTDRRTRFPPCAIPSSKRLRDDV